MIIFPSEPDTDDESSITFAGSLIIIAELDVNADNVVERFAKVVILYDELETLIKSTDNVKVGELDNEVAFEIWAVVKEAPLVVINLAYQAVYSESDVNVILLNEVHPESILLYEVHTLDSIPNLSIEFNDVQPENILPALVTFLKAAVSIEANDVQ